MVERNKLDLHWSFSSLEGFKTCPRQFEHVKLKKLVPESKNEATLWGTRVHEALEQRLRDGIPLPPSMKDLDVLAAKFLDRPGTLYVEKKLAVNKSYEPVEWDSPDVWCRGIIDVMVVDGDKAVMCDWKGLPLDTRLPTPTGWTTMGEISVGDTLFSESGKQCKVVGKSEIKHINCYKITFDDTTSVVCDEEHLWKLHDGSVKRVTELAVKDYIRVCAPIDTPSVELPIDPYVLGLWLADGKHSSSEISKPDTFIWEEIERRGYKIGRNTGKVSCPTRTVLGIRAELHKLNLYKNKHIPDIYLRASYQQRLDLLRGLMDGDGSVNSVRGQAIFTTVRLALSRQVRELLLSLGQRPLINYVTSFGFGKYVDNYPISFRPIGINPFSLPRKADRVLPSWGAGKSWRRAVVSVEQVDSVPTQCIAVDSTDHTFLCTDYFIPTHNTGKIKPQLRQLKLFALLTFAHFPEVQTCKTMFAWIKFNESTKAEYKREDLKALWGEFLFDVSLFEEAILTDTFNPRPSGLCNGWCPVKTCEFWREKRK